MRGLLQKAAVVAVIATDRPQLLQDVEDKAISDEPLREVVEIV